MITVGVEANNSLAFPLISWSPRVNAHSALQKLYFNVGNEIYEQKGKINRSKANTEPMSTNEKENFLLYDKKILKTYIIFYSCFAIPYIHIINREIP